LQLKNFTFLNLLLFILIFTWCLGIIWEFLLNFFPSTIVFIPFMKYNYSLVCHSDPGKLFYFNSLHTFTCARCTGIYFGSLVISFLLLAGLRFRISLKLCLLTGIPVFIDISLYTLGIYNYSKIVALYTGILLGSAGFIYIQNSLIDYIQKK
jgi:uncharacterized membrane protein